MLKDNSRFDFDKTIHIDRFLNKNKVATEKAMKKLEKLHENLSVLRSTHLNYSQAVVSKEGKNSIDILEQSEAILKGTFNHENSKVSQSTESLEEDDDF